MMNYKKKLNELESRVSPENNEVTINVYLDDMPADKKLCPGDVLITVKAGGAVRYVEAAE